MEEAIGRLWHRLVTRAADGTHPQAAARLKDLSRPLAIFFRALGGDPGLRLASATAERPGHRRRWLARVAGSGERLFPSRRDHEALRLPPVIDAFPDAALNRDAYFWLAALAAELDAETPPRRHGDDASHRNQRATLRVLRDWPGMARRYRRLVDAYLPRRRAPRELPDAEARREAAIQQALRAPGSVERWPDVPAKTPPGEPVLLWLRPDSGERVAARSAEASDAAGAPHGETKDGGEATHKAERADAPRDKHGLLLPFRAESLLSLAEFFRINRSVDDDGEPDPEAAQDLDQLAIAPTRNGERLAARVRFDLDLPSAAEDDDRIGVGIALPEWDYRKNLLRPNHVFVQDMLPRHAVPSPLPPRLAPTARRLRERFALLRAGRRWAKARPDGSELDLDAVVRAHTDRACRRTPGENLHMALERRERDLACLLLADLSLSTDAWVSNEARVIDVIRDALLLFGEALRATGDRFALCGFSSVKRHHVRFQRLKDFSAPFDARARGHIEAIRPGYYTRLGAAIRRASRMLEQEPAARRLLLILSDGKPNDLDLYDSRYGIEDTRMAVVEARRAGLLPFCLTIDRDGGDYLKRLFGPNGYAMLRRPEDLPHRLPMLYAQLTR
ncbi:MAG: nitric oxide reductase [Azoarcus sp.]|jgi:nitric oxide reductase NorD protein|nr:nitric oxide reductase [Azoarcus sp.]